MGYGLGNVDLITHFEEKIWVLKEVVLYEFNMMSPIN